MKSKILEYLEAQQISADSDQLQVIEMIDSTLKQKRSLFTTPRYSGVYIWGPPGRGKSMLMDACMANSDNGVRIHFHEFLKELSARVHNYGHGVEDSLPKIIDDWFREYDRVYFDEFHVHDIADSVLITNFLKHVCTKSKSVILTSNYEPDQLFPNSVYRNNFLPTIEFIKARFQIVSMENHGDYRVLEKPNSTNFFTPIGTEMRVIDLISQVDDTVKIRDKVVKLSRCKLNSFAQGERTIGINFADICCKSTSYIDYLEMAQRWDILFLAKIEDRHFSRRDAMLRFVWLLDVMYDNRVQLYTTSDKPLIALIEEHLTVEDADRAISRLHEMQSWY